MGIGIENVALGFTVLAIFLYDQAIPIHFRSKRAEENIVRLEDLAASAQVNGIVPDQQLTVVGLKWHGQTAIELFYKCVDGQTGSQLLYRSGEACLEIGPSERSWSIDTDGAIFCLAANSLNRDRGNFK